MMRSRGVVGVIEGEKGGRGSKRRGEERGSWAKVTHGYPAEK